MISMIAAIGKNREIGKDNKLLWHIKSDMENFKRLTMNKYIVMGKNTYLSLPKKLEGRKYIILSKSIDSLPNAIVYHDLESLLKFINGLNEEVMIIGGASIYNEFMPYADRLYISHINKEAQADAYFPVIESDWHISVVDIFDEYIYKVYERN